MRYVDSEWRARITAHSIQTHKTIVRIVYRNRDLLIPTLRVLPVLSAHQLYTVYLSAVHIYIAVQTLMVP